MKNLFLASLISFIAVGCGKVSNSNSGAVPTAPTSLTATLASSIKVNLSWTDNSTDESGFKIERKTGTGGYGLIGITASNVTTYIDTLVSNNTNYTYRVYSYNSTGNSSTYANEASISIPDTTAPQDTMATKIKNGLVAWYPFTGNANDSSGYGNNGTIVGATLTADRFGNSSSAYSFDGISSYIRCDGGSAYDLSTFTLSFWINIPNLSFNGNYIALGSASSVKWGPYHYNGLGMATGVGCTGGYTSVGNTLSTNEWKQVVMIVESNVVKVYLDGSYQGSNNNTLGSGCDNSYLYMGVDIFSVSEYWQGKLDEVRLYNRVLTQSEITYLASH